MAVTIKPAEWPRHDATIASLDASYLTDRVYRVRRGALSFRLSAESVDPPVRGLSSPLSEYLADLHAAQHAVVADDAGTVVGVAAADVEWNRRVRVGHIYVAATARGRGVGRALMESVLAFARARGSPCVWLETQAANYAAVQFYRRLGFRLCGLDERFYDLTSPAGTDTALFFALDLLGP
jgi:ribosomal protein S18 acetylase RimI-like enzyme